MIISRESLTLAGMALVLIWPVTQSFARAQWVSRAPRFALALWTSCGLAIAFCLLATLLSLGRSPQGQGAVSAVSAVRAVRNLPSASFLPHVPLRAGCAVIGTTALLIWMILRLIHTFVKVGLERRRHLQTLRLIGSPDSEHDVLVVDSDHALAYCVPGIIRSTIVVTRGCLNLADPQELRAVLAHERAHAEGRHDLLLTAFIAWQRTFPFLGGARTAVSAVSALTEMLADDVASRTVGARSTVNAICRLHAGRPGAGDTYGWSLDPPTPRRVRRLLARVPDSRRFPLPRPDPRSCGHDQ